MDKKNIKISYYSFKGINRERNKDGIIVVQCDSYALVGVLDGVSSAVNSAEAVKIAIEYVEKNHGRYLKKGAFSLSSLMFDLNNLLVSSNLQDPYTTCSLLYVSNTFSDIKLSNIGDSRIYAVTSQFIEKLTIDDTDKYNKNILLKYLGDADLARRDFFEADYNGDARRFLLCSDGFYNVFESNNRGLLRLHEILNINHSFYIEDNIKKYVAGKNSDDATYIILRY